MTEPKSSNDLDANEPELSSASWDSVLSAGSSLSNLQAKTTLENAELTDIVVHRSNSNCPGNPSSSLLANHQARKQNSASVSVLPSSCANGNKPNHVKKPRFLSEAVTRQEHADQSPGEDSMWMIGKDILRTAAKAKRGSIYLRAMSVGAWADFMVRKVVPPQSGPVATGRSGGRLYSTSKLSAFKDLAEESIEQDEDNEELQPSVPPLLIRQKLTIVMLCLANLANCVVFSCIAPFFPQEAADKGVSSSVQGFIFGIFELVIFFCSPLYGRNISAIGPKFLFTVGLLVTGATSILFGFLNLCPPGLPFILLCFAVRIVEAVGTSAFTTASFTIVANEFPGRTGSIVGWMETFNGLGYMGGPTIGGLLYDLGGFQLPFLVLGSILMVAGLVSIPLLKGLEVENEKESGERGSALKMLRIPSLIIMLFSTGVSTASLAFLDPTLQPYLTTFGLKPFYVGLFFLITSAVYTTVSPLVGWFVDRKGHGKPVIFFGTAVMVVSFLLSGPSPFFNITPNLAITGVAMGLLGIGIATQLIPPFTQCLAAAKAAGFADNFHTFGMVSGLFQGASSMGSFIGPTFGGWLSGQVGFPYAASVMAALHFCLLIVLGLFLSVSKYRDCWRCGRKRIDYNPLD